MIKLRYSKSVRISTRKYLQRTGAATVSELCPISSYREYSPLKLAQFVTFILAKGEVNDFKVSLQTK